MRLKFDDFYLRYALRLTVSCILITLLYRLLHLDHGYWAVFSVLACVFPTSGQSILRSKQRIIGSFIGMILGILIGYTLGHSLVYADILILIVVFLTVYLKVFSYSYYNLFNMAITVLLICLIEPGSWQVAYIRMEMTLIGTVIAILATYLILPTKSNEDEVKQQLNSLHQALQNHYIAVSNKFINQDSNQMNTFAITGKESKMHLENAANKITDIFNQKLSKSNTTSLIKYNETCVTLEKIYQLLLMLELQIPEEINHPDLQLMKALIPEIMDRTLIIFNQLFNLKYLDSDIVDNDISTCLNTLEYELNSNLTRIIQLRKDGAQNPNLQVATFSEHIKINMMLEYLKHLILEIGIIVKT